MLHGPVLFLRKPHSTSSSFSSSSCFARDAVRRPSRGRVDAVLSEMLLIDGTVCTVCAYSGLPCSVPTRERLSLILRLGVPGRVEGGLACHMLPSPNAATQSSRPARWCVVLARRAPSLYRSHITRTRAASRTDAVGIRSIGSRPMSRSLFRRVVHTPQGPHNEGTRKYAETLKRRRAGHDTARTKVREAHAARYIARMPWRSMPLRKTTWSDARPF